MSGIGLLIVTLSSAALAAVMTVIAWRVARDERHRADARVAALAAEIHAENDLPLRHVPAPMAAAAEPFRQTAKPPSPASRLGQVAAIGMFVFASLAAIVIWLSPGPPTAPAGPIQAIASTTAPAGATAPLELVALTHEREGDRLNVRGVVRNPLSGGATFDGLAAVVLVYNHAGEFLMSARAPLPATELTPGSESTFVVAVPGAADVGRYRVSFRTDDHVVPHVDKRGPTALARVQ